MLAVVLCCAITVFYPSWIRDRYYIPNKARRTVKPVTVSLVPG